MQFLETGTHSSNSLIPPFACPTLVNGMFWSCHLKRMYNVLEFVRQIVKVIVHRISLCPWPRFLAGGNWLSLFTLINTYPLVLRELLKFFHGHGACCLIMLRE